MRIGQLAGATGADVETIRYYEREGLLAAPPRDASGYRRYDAAALRRLTFIRHCRALDVGLDGVRRLLAILDDPGCGCDTADSLVDAQIGRVRERIASLHALEATLVALRSRCEAPTTSASCRILEELARPA
jgi:DNA-binding transcriptional MerR regulator